MPERPPQPRKKEPNPEINVDNMSFAERKTLMRKMLELQARLNKELGFIPNGFETIRGQQIYVEEVDGKFFIHGLEYIGDAAVFVMDESSGRGLPKRDSRDEAIRYIYKVIEENGFTIIKQ